MTPRLFKCKHCPFQNYSFKKYKSHISTHWLWRRSDTKVATNTDEQEPVMDGIETTIKIESISDEITSANVTKIPTSVHGEDAEPTTQENERQDTTLPVYNCSRCLRNFHRKGPFIRHFNACKGLSDADGKNCNTVYESKPIAKPVRMQRLRRANKPTTLSIPGEDSYQCPVCKQSFFRIGNLFRHLKNSACSSNPSVSHLNNQTGFQKRKVEENNNVVTYGCPRCPKTFCYKKSMKHHLRSHVQIPEVQHFTCRICQKKFRHGFQLEIHLKTHVVQHPEYACWVCGKQFKYRWSLQLHKESHRKTTVPNRTTGKLFPCYFCGKSFAHKLAAAEHMKVHVLMSSHSCHICGNEYTTRNSLYKHIQVTHLKQPSQLAADRCEEFEDDFENKEDDFENEEDEIFDREETSSDNLQTDLPLQGRSAMSSRCSVVPESESSGAGRLDNDTLSIKVQRFISMLMDGVTLQELIEPGVPVATLLEKVIRYYGLNPVDCKQYPNGEGLRKNCRLLFAALLDDETVDELLIYFLKVANGRLS